MLFSHHGARQDIHISYSPGRERFPRSGDGVDLWVEDGTEDEGFCIIHQAIQTDLPSLDLNCQAALAPV